MTRRLVLAVVVTLAMVTSSSVFADGFQTPRVSPETLKTVIPAGYKISKVLPLSATRGGRGQRDRLELSVRVRLRFAPRLRSLPCGERQAAPLSHGRMERLYFTVYERAIYDAGVECQRNRSVLTLLRKGEVVVSKSQ